MSARLSYENPQISLIWAKIWKYSGTCPNDHLCKMTICKSRPLQPGPKCYNVVNRPINLTNPTTCKLQLTTTNLGPKDHFDPVYSDH